ncbi:ParA family protein [Halobacteriovorax sp. HLS]|uniref:ParA family protein n=1 Tax=Halobacteriovorax sp. HLS TaxID=2234000 RepID=UPI0013E40CF3|nr:ParA family protein [Halobacteriovorax sp. HLS]
MGIFFNKQREKSPVGKGKVISFLNQKGGVGKTTMAFNTAHALAQGGAKVLCIDMDPQSNLSYLFNIDVNETGATSIFQLLINSVRELKPLHRAAIWTDVLCREGDIDILPAGQELSGLELTVAGINGARQLILKKFIELNSLKTVYDYIIIDGPPTLGLIVVNILCASDGAIVPFRPDDFSRKGLNHFYEVLEDISDMGVSQIPEVLAHIPNLVDSRRKQESDDLLKIKNSLDEHFGGQAVVTAPFLNKAQLVKSQSQKKSVYDYASKEFLPLQGQFNDMAQIIKDWSKESHSEH